MKKDVATVGAGRAGVSERTQGRRNRFLAVLAETCSVAIAAKMAKRSVSTCYRWRTEDAPFAAAWDAALDDGYARLEAGLLEYALAKIERGGGGDREAGAGTETQGMGEHAALPAPAISNADLQFAMALLLRRRSAGDSGKKAKAFKLPTSEETDAALRRALDGLARQVKAA